MMTSKLLKLSCLAFALATSSVASAFHVQVGITGKTQSYDRGWYSHSIEIGKVAQHLADTPGDGWLCTCGNNYITLGHTGQSGTARGPDCVYLQFLKGAGLGMRASTVSESYTEQYGSKRFTAAKSVVLGSFGYTYMSYIDERWVNVVATFRGNPYSCVMNDTDNDITVNGVRIIKGTSAKLAFPIYLCMEEIEGVKFYDMDSMEEIQPIGQGYQGSESYYDGAYFLSWTGDILIKKEYENEREVPMEPLLFADLKGGDTENKLLYGKTDSLIYSDPTPISTNFSLSTWWDFDQNSYGLPHAYINGEDKCPGHSTTHIIPYDVATQGAKCYPTGCKIDFNMSIGLDGSHSGGSCVFKVFDSNYYYTNWDSIPAGHKAAFSGDQSSCPTFRVTIKPGGEWSVKAL